MGVLISHIKSMFLLVCWFFFFFSVRYCINHQREKCHLRYLETAAGCWKWRMAGGSPALGAFCLRDAHPRPGRECSCSCVTAVCTN